MILEKKDSGKKRRKRRREKKNVCLYKKYNVFFFSILKKFNHLYRLLGFIGLGDTFVVILLI